MRHNNLIYHLISLMWIVVGALNFLNPNKWGIVFLTLVIVMYVQFLRIQNNTIDKILRDWKHSLGKATNALKLSNSLFEELKKKKKKK